MIKKTSWTNK